MKKKICGLVMTLLFVSLIGVIGAFAGQWQLGSNHLGWSYRNDDGSYLKNGWHQVDSTYYYFDSDGYILIGQITPDGYVVDVDGKWIPGEKAEPVTNGYYSDYIRSSNYISIYSDPSWSTATSNDDGNSGWKLSIENNAKIYNLIGYSDKAKGNLINIGNGTYYGDDSMDGTPDCNLSKLYSTTNYIFAHSAGEGDGGWRDVIRFKR